MSGSPAAPAPAPAPERRPPAGNGQQRAAQRPPVTVVLSQGSGSMEVLASELASRVGAARIYSDRYRRSAERFNAGWHEAVTGLPGEAAFVRALRRGEGLLHFPHHHFARYGPLAGRPYIVTVHDLIRQFDRRRPAPLIHRPSRLDRVALALDVAGIRRARALIAISHTTRRDLVEHLGVPPERIHVVYPGIDTGRFRRVPGDPGGPYLLFVGSEHPRKNLSALLRALAILRRRHPDLGLLKVGAPGGPEAPFRAATEQCIRDLGLGDAVELLGRVSHERLVALLSGARCLVQPSLYEGFGLPPLEAMACGCPVIVSNRGALPETAGPAALVTPPDPEALARAIERVLETPALAARLRRCGEQHVLRFSWDRAAEETVGVYRSVCTTPDERVRFPRCG